MSKRSSGYIGGILRLVADYATSRVLDFGGGIGTHAIAAALCPKVTEVTYVDLNTENCNFVRERSQKLGLSHKLHISSMLDNDDPFDTIMCFDVIEHLPDPVSQLLFINNSIVMEHC